MSESEQLSFQQLALSEPILKALNDVGYETPSPIQAETIPLLLSGRDVLGQAQTGTGKTAAFALPALSNIDISQRDPQILVLAPTRELAIQVAEAFHKYAKHIKGFNVLPIPPPALHPPLRPTHTHLFSGGEHMCRVRTEIDARFKTLTQPLLCGGG